MSKLAVTITIYSEIPADGYHECVELIKSKTFEVLDAFGATGQIHAKRGIPADASEELS
jgi:hypothetical protein